MTAIVGTVVGLTFLFAFGNVATLGIRLGMPTHIAFLVTPAVDLSVVALLIGTRFDVAFGRGVHACPGAPLSRAEAVVSLTRLLDRTSHFWIDEEKHGPAGARRYRYLPTFMLRGLTRLHIEFSE